MAPSPVPPAVGAAPAYPPQGLSGAGAFGGTVAADPGVFAAFAAQQEFQPHGQPPPSGVQPPAYALNPAAAAGTRPMAALDLSNAAAPPAPYPPYAAAQPVPPFAPGAPPLPPPPATGTVATPTAGLVPGFPPPAAPGLGGPPPPLPPFGGAPPYGAPVEPFGQPLPAAPLAQPLPPLPSHPPVTGAAMPVGVGYASAPSQGRGTLKSEVPISAAPRRRNALATALLPMGVIFVGAVLGELLGLVSPVLASLGFVVMLAGSAWALLIAVQLVAELRAVTRSESLVWWPLVVPVYNMYFMWLVVPQEMARAKQMLGVRRPLQPMLLYVLLWPFAFASDLNDLVQ